MCFVNQIIILIKLTKIVNNVTLIVKYAIYKYAVNVNQIFIIHKANAFNVMQLIVRFLLIVISQINIV